MLTHQEMINKIESHFKEKIHTRHLNRKKENEYMQIIKRIRESFPEEENNSVRIQQ